VWQGVWYIVQDGIVLGVLQSKIITDTFSLIDISIIDGWNETTLAERCIETLHRRLKYSQPAGVATLTE